MPPRVHRHSSTVLGSFSAQRVSLFPPSSTPDFTLLDYPGCRVALHTLKAFMNMQFGGSELDSGGIGNLTTDVKDN